MLETWEVMYVQELEDQFQHNEKHKLVVIIIDYQGGFRPLQSSAVNPPGELANHKNVTAFYIKYFSYLFQR